MKEKSYTSAVVSVLMVISIFFAVMFWKEMNLLNNAYADMNEIEFISSTTQRLIGLAHSKHENIIQKDIFFINDSTEKTLVPDGGSALSVLDNPDMVDLADEVIDSWEKISYLVSEEELNTIDLSLARDSHYKAMTNLSAGINDYTKELNSYIRNYQIIVMSIIFMITFLVLNNLLRTHTELRLLHQITEVAQIDIATGLYNRSRCHDVLQIPAQPENTNNTAVIMFDLNDLKRTNDTLGHSVGDDLIYSFAKVLKNACKVHLISPFVGRYGGDEFIMYYEDIENEDEIKLFLNELEYLTNETNAQETRYRVFYAVGYCFIPGDAEEKLSTIQMFDEADKSMFVNKAEVKTKKQRTT